MPLIERSRMSQERTHHVPWIFWPFAALWGFLAFVLNLTGRLIGVVLGLALMIVGFILTLTVVGAPFGIPIGIVGFLLLLRSLF